MKVGDLVRHRHPLASDRAVGIIIQTYDALNRGWCLVCWTNGDKCSSRFVLLEVINATG